MSWPSIVSMILILSVVWGGFFFCLRTALRRESKKQEGNRLSR